MSSLLTACSAGDITLVKQILAEQDHPDLPLKSSSSSSSASSSSSSASSSSSTSSARARGIAVTDSERRTCLHHAAMNGHLRLVRHLVENGAKALMEKNDRSRETPLFLACRGGFPRLCYYLIEEAQANIHGRNIDGRSLLHICVESGDLETAAVLVKRGLELNARDKYGETPLHAAVAQRSLPFAQFLLKHGASPALASGTGRSALMLAQEIEDDDDFIQAFEQLAPPTVGDRKRKAEGGSAAQNLLKRARTIENLDDGAVKPSAAQKRTTKGRSKTGAEPTKPAPVEPEVAPTKRRGHKATRSSTETDLAISDPAPEMVKKTKKSRRMEPQAAEVEKVKRRADKGKQKEESEGPLHSAIDFHLAPGNAFPRKVPFRPPPQFDMEHTTKNHLFELAQERRAGDRMFGGGVVHRIRQDLEKEGFCANAFEDDYSGGFGGRVMDVVSHIVI